MHLIADYTPTAVTAQIDETYSTAIFSSTAAYQVSSEPMSPTVEPSYVSPSIATAYDLTSQSIDIMPSSAIPIYTEQTKVTVALEESESTTSEITTMEQTTPTSIGVTSSPTLFLLEEVTSEMDAVDRRHSRWSCK